MSEEVFGPNVWLIDEMYRQYLDTPDSVAESWRDFFADYKPSPMNSELSNLVVKNEAPKKLKNRLKSVNQKIPV